MATSPYLESLEVLELHANPISLAGVRSLLEGLPRLRRLGAYGVRVTAGEREALRQLRPDVELQIGW